MKESHKIVVQKTYIDGLDTILRRRVKEEERGIVLLKGENLSLLLKGYAGSGKTTMALQMAVNISKNRRDNQEDKDFSKEHFCLYFYSGQTDAEILTSFKNFHWDKKDVRLFNVKRIKETHPFKFAFREYNFHADKWMRESPGPPMEQGNNVKGVYLIELNFQDESNNIKDVIYDLVREFNPSSDEKEWPRLIVVDSFNAILNKKEIERNDIINMRNLFLKQNFTTIFLFILEKRKETHELEQLDYYFNMVIDLDYYVDFEYLFRTIQIQKARNQEHALGKHQYKINTIEGGMTVIPSQHFILSEYKPVEFYKEEGLRFYGERIISTGTKGLDEMLWKGKEISGVFDKSATIILGEAGTKKSVLGLNFLRDGICDFKGNRKENPERVLFLSLREDFSTVIKTATKYGINLEDERFKSKDSEHFCDNVDCLIKKTFEKSGRKAFKGEDYKTLFRIEYFRPGYISPDEFVNKIRKSLSEYQLCEQCKCNCDKCYDKEKKTKKQGHLRGIKFKRVVLDDVAQFDLRFPLFAKSAILLPTLIDIFKSEGITSMFIDVLDKEEFIEGKQKLSEIVDNILILMHLSFYGKSRTGISVRRLHGGVYESDFQEVLVEEIILNGNEEKINKIEISPNFDRFVNLETKKPKHAPLEINLYQESDQHKEFNDLVKGSLRSVYEGSVKVKSFDRKDDENYHFSIYSKEDIPLTNTKVIVIDEYWVDSLIETGRLIKLTDNRYEKIFKEFVREISGVNEIRFDEFFEYKEVDAQRLEKRKQYVLPYFLNMEILCFQKKLLLKYGKKLNNGKTLIKEENYKAIKNNIFDKIKWDWDDIVEIATFISQESGEFDPFFFYGGKEHSESLNCLFLNLLGVLDNNSDIFSFDELHDNDIQEASKKILTFKKNKIKYDDEYTEFPKAVFWISWYSDFIRMIKDKKTEIGFASLPNGGISGEWYLGVVEGSVSPLVGVEAVKYISSIELDREKFKHYIGMPSRKKFLDSDVFFPWKKSPSFSGLIGIFRESKSRSQIKNYLSFRGDLEIIFRKIMTPKVDSQNDIKKYLEELKGLR